MYVGARNSSWNDPANFLCPNQFADILSTSVTLPCVTTGRFVWVVVPGLRSLTLCGLQVRERAREWERESQLDNERHIER